MSSYNWSPIQGGGSGGVVSINGLEGALTLAAGTGITITPSGGDTLTIASTSAGDITLTAVGSTPNANGASLSGQALTLQPANASFPGVLTAADWNTFNAKQAALTIGNLTAAGTDGIAVTSGTGAIIGAGTSIAQHVADTTHNGYLTATDWNTFNGKQASGNYITALTGDATAAGPGSAALTLATVNSNVGSFGSASSVSAITVNAKGLVTAAASTAIQIAESQVTNLTTDLAAKQSTALTSAHILVGNVSNIATDVAMSGAISIDNTGATAYAGTVPVNKGGTGITSGTSGGILAYTASGTLASSNALTASQLIIGGGAGVAPSTLAAGSQYQVLVMGASNPGYGALNLAQSAAVTGTLAIANGGTNNGSLAVTGGGVLYTDGTKVMNTGAGTASYALISNAGSAPSFANIGCTLATLQSTSAGATARNLSTIGAGGNYGKMTSANIVIPSAGTWQLDVSFQLQAGTGVNVLLYSNSGLYALNGNDDSTVPTALSTLGTVLGPATFADLGGSVACTCTAGGGVSIHFTTIVTFNAGCTVYAVPRIDFGTVGTSNVSAHILGRKLYVP